MTRKRRLGLVDELLLRVAGEHPRRSREELRQHAAHRGRAHTLRPSRLWIPEVGVVESIVALHRDLILVASEHEHLGVVGDGWRRGRARQRDFVGPICDQVLSYWC